MICPAGGPPFAIFEGWGFVPLTAFVHHSTPKTLYLWACGADASKAMKRGTADFEVAHRPKAGGWAAPQRQIVSVEVRGTYPRDG